MNPLQQRYQYLSPPEVARQYVDDILAAAKHKAAQQGVSPAEVLQAWKQIAAASPDEVRLSAVCAAISALAVEGAHSKE